MTIEIKIKKTPVYEIKSYKEDEFYVTSDGKEFEKEKEAIAWQNTIDFKTNNDRILASIKKIDLGDFYFLKNLTWYFIENQEQLDYLKWTSDFDGKYDYHYFSGEWKIGEWIAWESEDCGDYKTYSYYTLTFVKEEISKFLNNLPE